MESDVNDDEDFGSAEDGNESDEVWNEDWNEDWDEDNEVGAFSNDHFEEKPAWVRQKKETIKTFKFFSGMFFRALNGMPKSKKDVEERDAIAFFAAFDGVLLSTMDDMLLSRIVSRNFAMRCCERIAYRSHDDIHFRESDLRNRYTSFWLFNSLYRIPLDLCEEFESEMTLLLEQKTAKLTSAKLDRAKRRKRGRNGKKTKKEKTVNCSTEAHVELCSLGSIMDSEDSLSKQVPRVPTCGTFNIENFACLDIHTSVSQCKKIGEDTSLETLTPPSLIHP